MEYKIAVALVMAKLKGQEVDDAMLLQGLKEHPTIGRRLVKALTPDKQEELKFKHVKDKHPGMELLRVRDNREIRLEQMLVDGEAWMATDETEFGRMPVKIWPDDEVVVIE